MKTLKMIIIYLINYIYNYNIILYILSNKNFIFNKIFINNFNKKKKYFIYIKLILYIIIEEKNYFN